MGIFSDVVLSIPIGIIYNMMIHKIGEIFNSDLNYKDRVQRNLLILFGGGILGLILAMSVFGTKNKYKNRALRYGLYIGSCLLLGHSIMYNWGIMQNDSKFIVMSLVLSFLIWYTYTNIESGDGSDVVDNDALSNFLPASYISYEQYGGKNEHYDEQYDENDREDYEEIVDYERRL